MKLKKFDPIEIDWVDSLSDEGGWTLLENYDYDDLYSNLAHKSAGYLIRESKDAITLAHSIRDNKTFMLGVMTIPKGCIKKITKIKTSQIISKEQKVGCIDDKSHSKYNKE